MKRSALYTKISQRIVSKFSGTFLSKGLLARNNKN